MLDIAALASWTRVELVDKARQLGVERPERMTRLELRDEIRRLTGPRGAQEESRGLLGTARSMIASMVEAGLNMPEAAAVIRGEAGFDVRVKNQPPVATVTLAEIYAAQGHRKRALHMLDDVLAAEPDHEVARELRQRLESEGEAKPTEARESAPGDAPDPFVETTGEEIRTGKPPEVAPIEPAPSDASADSIAAGQDESQGDQDASQASQDDVLDGQDGLRGGQDEVPDDQDRLPDDQDRPRDDQDRSQGGQDRSQGGQDRPRDDQDDVSGGQDDVSGGQDDVSGGQDVPQGGRDRPRDDQDRFQGGQDRPQDDQDRPQDDQDDFPGGQDDFRGDQDDFRGDQEQIADDQEPSAEPNDTAGEVPAAAVEAALEPDLGSPGESSEPLHAGDEVPPSRDVAPGGDALFLRTGSGGTRLYWELSPTSVDRARRRMPEGKVVLRVVAMRPSVEGTARVDVDLPVEAATGVTRLADLQPPAIVRAALGWLAPEGFTPLAVATDLDGGYRPPVSESAAGAEDRARDQLG